VLERRRECWRNCGKWERVGAVQKNMLFFLHGDSDLPCVYGSAARVNRPMSEQRAAFVKHYPAHSGAAQSRSKPTRTNVTRETPLSAERHIERVAKNPSLRLFGRGASQKKLISARSAPRETNRICHVFAQQ